VAVASPTLKTGRVRSGVRAAKAARPLALVKARAVTPVRSGAACGMGRMASRGAIRG